MIECGSRRGGGGSATCCGKGCGGGDSVRWILVAVEVKEMLFVLVMFLMVLVEDMVEGGDRGGGGDVIS